MNPAWSAEWLVALRRRRQLLLNTIVPLCLVAPIALVGAPPAHAAAVYSVLFVLFGVFGSAIPLLRDGGSGLLLRWKLAGLPARETLTSRIGAQTALDVLQAAPSVALIVLASGSDASRAAGVIVALPFTLLVANALGAWTAAAARSLAEGALFSSVVALLLLHAAGTFRTPVAGSLGETIERVSPFRTLHEAFLAAVGGGTAPPGQSWTPALAVGAVFMLLTAAAAGPLLERITRTRE